MSKIAEKVCVWLNNLMPKPDLSRTKSNEAYSKFEYEMAKRDWERFRTHISIEGKKVIDIACGSGGKTTYYSDIGAEDIVGIDMNGEHIKSSYSFCTNRGQTNKVKFLIANAHNLPFRSNTFDIAFISAALEHLCKPLEALKESKRVLKPGGIMCINFPNYFGPEAHHLNWHIFIPWCHIIFSDKTLLNTISKIEGDPYYSQHRTIKEFQHLNRLTVRRFKEIVQKTDLEMEYFYLDPVRIPLLRVRLRLLTLVPLLNEVFTGEVVCILGKKTGET